MILRVKRRLHVFAERFFSEQRLFLRNETSTRFLRLTPLMQMGITTAAALVFGWTIFASSAFLIDALGASSNQTQAKLQQMDYEARLNALSAERDKRTLEAQKAQQRFYVALGRISAQQSAILASEGRRIELETGVEVIQRTLRKTMQERDLAKTQADKLLAELQSASGTERARFDNAKETDNTLNFMNTALAATVRERDAMIVTDQKLDQRVAKLRLRARLTRERNQRIFARLESAVTLTIDPLKKLFKSVGLSPAKLMRDVKRGYSGIGGPLQPISVSSKGTPDDPTSIRANRLLLRMNQLNLLRIAARRTPLLLPLKSTFRLSSPFGMRRDPINGRYSLHPGDDMAAPKGTPVYATADGVIAYAGWAGGYGRLIRIRHAMGFQTRYGHLSKIRVKIGQRVSQGQRIGDMGSSGHSTGPHVHYEVRVNGRPVNPMKYIKAAKNVL